ncbi:hypothetical protein ENBRE01_2480 [Enteropsectra breve]|nr:hypothetical protein ENBRE01_2480 [Enteropsectra breve]
MANDKLKFKSFCEYLSILAGIIACFYLGTIPTYKNLKDVIRRRAFEMPHFHSTVHDWMVVPANDVRTMTEEHFFFRDNIQLNGDRRVADGNPLRFNANPEGFRPLNLFYWHCGILCKFLLESPHFREKLRRLYAGDPRTDIFYELIIRNGFGESGYSVFSENRGQEQLHFVAYANFFMKFYSRSPGEFIEAVIQKLKEEAAHDTKDMENAFKMRTKIFDRCSKEKVTHFTGQGIEAFSIELDENATFSINNEKSAEIENEGLLSIELKADRISCHKCNSRFNGCRRSLGVLTLPDSLIVIVKAPESLKYTYPENSSGTNYVYKLAAVVGMEKHIGKGERESFVFIRIESEEVCRVYQAHSIAMMNLKEVEKYFCNLKKVLLYNRELAA